MGVVGSSRFGGSHIIARRPDGRGKKSVTKSGSNSGDILLNTRNRWRDGAPPSDAVADACDVLTFRWVDKPGEFPLSHVYRHLVHEMVDALKTGRSRVALCWPVAPLGVSAVGTLSALVDIASRPKTTRMIDGNAYVDRQPPLGLKVLYAPWRRGAAGHQRQVAVNRKPLLSEVRPHAARAHRDCVLDGSLGQHLMTLMRLQDIDGSLKVDENGKSLTPRKRRPVIDFQDPTLEEVMPFAVVGDAAIDRRLLHRTARFVHVDKTIGAHPASVKDAFSITCGLKGLPGSAHALRTTAPDMDVVLLDLTQRSCDRLGLGWFDLVTGFLKAVRNAYGRIPVLVVTDTPFVQARLVRDVLPHHDGCHQDSKSKDRDTRTAVSKQIPVINGSLLPADGTAPVGQALSKVVFQVESVGDLSLDLFHQIDQQRHLAKDAGDAVSVDRLNEIAASLRRRLMVPGTATQLGKTLIAQYGDIVAARHMEMYQPDLAIRRAMADERAIFLQERLSFLQDLLEKVQSRLPAGRDQSPLGLLIRRVAEDMARKSSRTMFVFQNGEAAAIATAHLCGDPTNGSRYKSKIESGLWIITTAASVLQRTHIADAWSAIGNMVVVNMRPQDLYRLVVAPHMPANVLFLLDRRRVETLHRTCSSVLSLEGLAVFHARIRAVVAGLQPVMEDIAKGPGMLDVWFSEGLTEDAMPEASRSTGTVVDLRDAGDHSGERRVLTMADGSQVVAGKKSELVAHDEDRPLNPFFRTTGEKLTPGMRLAVLDEGYYEWAKEKYGRLISADEVLREFHEILDIRLERFRMRDGKIDAKAILGLIRAAGCSSISLTQVQDWTRTEKRLEEDMTVVRPHVAHTPEIFAPFARAVGLTERDINTYWPAIERTRNMRRKAGRTFHAVCRDFLAGSADLEAMNDDVASGARALRVRADMLVGEIVDIKDLDGKTR